MHLENGAVTPTCAAIALGLSGVAVGAAVVALRRESALTLPQVGKAVGLGAVVFSAQMLNFQVSDISSAHLIGSALLAWTLGPAVGLITAATVLSAQALFMADGGLMSLGANILNMAVVPVAMVMALTAIGRGPDARRPWSDAAGLAVAAFAGTVLGALFLVGQVGLFRGAEIQSGFGSFAKLMAGSHVIAGLAEAAISVAVLLAVRAVERRDAATQRPVSPLALSVVSVLMLATLPLASRLHDGYEAAIEAAGLRSMVESNVGVTGWFNALQSSITAMTPAWAVVHLALFVVMIGALLTVVSRAGRAGSAAR